MPVSKFHKERVTDTCDWLYECLSLALLLRTESKILGVLRDYGYRLGWEWDSQSSQLLLFFSDRDTAVSVATDVTTLPNPDTAGKKLTLWLWRELDQLHACLYAARDAFWGKCMREYLIGMSRDAVV